jgi:hypothetical protein
MIDIFVGSTSRRKYWTRSSIFVGHLTPAKKTAA